MNIFEYIDTLIRHFKQNRLHKHTLLHTLKADSNWRYASLESPEIKCCNNCLYYKRPYDSSKYYCTKPAKYMCPTTSINHCDNYKRTKWA